MAKQSNFDMVLFGATGDLAMRKLLPSLYQAHAAGLLHSQGRILGVSRSGFSREAFLAKVESDAKIHIKQHFDEAAWTSFLARIDYLPVDVTRPEQFAALSEKINSRRETDCVAVYLSTAPKFFAAVCKELAAAGLNGENVRIVLEKPLGSDLESNREINREVARYFCENQIYRIDHYLGKETLQNLLPLRFANPVFEAVWNREYLKSVEITVAERLGVEERGEFYDTAGALRDMLQNHMVQMLCFAAMERPKSLAADDVRDAKLAVLQALRPMNQTDAAGLSVRAQYTAADGMKGYTQETRVPSESRTETYVALEARLDNERWHGVPFYLRTGKRLPERKAEIILNFKADAALFGAPASRLIIRLQPDEGVYLELPVKQKGSGMELGGGTMRLRLDEAAPGRAADAYEIMLLEVIAGRQNLFNRRDELEAAWAWLMPVLQHWQESEELPETYPAGTWGPQAARDLLSANGDKWAEEYCGGV
ncbi:MAG: glucose-6-phosphate dehydrogenase [Neisseria sp.]|nr:glucose-6-phosphate dehydrogenase [Neisseria sp.]